jgi:poly-gamma-glutamate capsule biosynthesis protein CapA/YwtB (metallophosphatase superfamily)
MAIAAQEPPQPPPPPPSAGRLSAPRVRATGIAIPVTGAGVAVGTKVTLERLLDGKWKVVRVVTADARGRWSANVVQRPAARRIRLRAAVVGATPAKSVLVKTRAVTLASVGDINLGDGVADVIGARGAKYPWSGVAPVLRSADVAFGNLECAVSTRGSRVEKQFNFRGHPSWLKVTRTYVGMDVMNLANNHAGDYGDTALLDTIAYVRRFGMVPVGAGSNLAAARKPKVIERFGLKIAFVGFSDIGPGSFAAGPSSPGTAFASDAAIRAGVSRAAKLAPIVVATFHWGVELARRPDGRQRGFANAALAAGADAVIGAHPHVLQPTEKRRGRRLVAFSLGNFVFAAQSAGTTETGILKLRLSGRGIESSRFIRAHIDGVRPRLTGR